MKKISLLILVTFITFTNEAQSIFQIYLYVQDSKGNRDSVLAGYDKNEPYNNLSADNGEIPIYTPFDSVFEVRLREWTATTELLPTVKTAITPYEGDCDPLGVSLTLELLVRAKHLPITFSWDKELLNTGIDSWCRSETFLTNTPLIFFVENMYIFDIIWMNQQDSYTENFDKPGYGYIPMLEAVEGIGQDTVWRFFLEFRTNTWRTSTEEAAPQELQNPYPNPCDSELRIDIPEQMEIRTLSLMNIAGTQQSPAFSQAGSTIKVETHALSKGIYFLLLLDREGKRYFTRFVKG